MLEASSTTSQLAEALASKTSLSSNPVGRLVESGQAIRAQVTFTIVDSSSVFVCEVACGELVVKGEARNKKDARKKAAMNMIEHVEGRKNDIDPLHKLEDNAEVIVKPAAKAEDSPTASPAAPVPSHRATWPACLALLTDHHQDWVRCLAIFAFNTDTGMPRYKVMKVIKDIPGPKKYNVLCTWNMFFLEGDGDSRGEAEQEAAMKMLNKVRSVCGMTEVVRDIEGESVGSLPDNTTAEMTDQMRGVMVKHSSLLIDPTLRGVVKLLETFSSKVNSPSPIYNITESSKSGCFSMVEVACKWISLTTTGKGSSKVMAEQKAALAMIKKINECVKQKEKSDSAMGVDDEPVRYLVYPGHGQAHGQASVTITSRDYLCLQAEQFLNDVIIDFYLKYLQIGLFCNNSLMDKTYTFSIYFYKRLTMNISKANLTMSQADIMHSNVKKWTKNVNIFEKDFIVIPINDCDHWFVIIICYPGLTSQRKEGTRVMQPLMLVLDSLEDGLKDSVCKDLRSYLTKEWNEKMKSSREFTASNMPGFCPKIPQQDNLTDCGLFLLQYVESFFNEPISDFYTPLISLANWFTTQMVNSKRENIAKLIRDLSVKQKKVLKFPDIGFPAELSLGAREHISTSVVNTIQPDTVPVPTPVTKCQIKLNLLGGPGGDKSSKQPVGGGKRGAETQLGGGKRRQEVQEEEEEQDWWCDY